MYIMILSIPTQDCWCGPTREGGYYCVNSRHTRAVFEEMGYTHSGPVRFQCYVSSIDPTYFHAHWPKW